MLLLVERGIRSTVFYEKMCCVVELFEELSTVYVEEGHLSCYQKGYYEKNRSNHKAI